MIKRKLAMAGRFACLCAAVFIVGSAIFGVITERVGEFQLLRLIIMSSISALIMTVGVTVSRAGNRRLFTNYREAAKRGHGTSFLFTSGELLCELLVTAILLAALAAAMLLSNKQLFLNDGVDNTRLAMYIVLGGMAGFIIFDTISWMIACATYREKNK
jgi:hypothetical protein